MLRYKEIDIEFVGARKKATTKIAEINCRKR